MSPTTPPPVPVPPRILDHLLEDFPRGTAAMMFPLTTRETSEPMLHPGDPFGEVLCWLWTSGQREAATALVHRLHEQVDTLDQPASWKQLLDYLPFALKTPQSISDDEYQNLMTHLRATPPTGSVPDDEPAWYLNVTNPETAVFGSIGRGRDNR